MRSRKISESDDNLSGLNFRCHRVCPRKMSRDKPVAGGIDDQGEIPRATHRPPTIDGHPKGLNHPPRKLLGKKHLGMGIIENRQSFGSAEPSRQGNQEGHSHCRSGELKQEG